MVVVVKKEIRVSKEVRIITHFQINFSENFKHSSLYTKLTRSMHVTEKKTRFDMA